MFIDKDSIPSRLEKGKLSNPPLPKNRAGNSSGQHPNSHETFKDNPDLNRGRSPGSPNIPIEVRATVGAIAKLSGVKRTSELFDTCISTVQDAKFGAISKTPDNALQEKMDEIFKPIRDAAIEKMQSALDAITPVKLALAKAGELAKVAANLSTVVKNTTVEQTAEKNQGHQVVIYAPQQKEESDYETITVN